MSRSVRPSREVSVLLQIMAALRTPGTGCPWDLEQDFASIAPYTIEEAYEVADAIERGDLENLREELGDLLLQVVFHARMAEEAGHFDFGAVVEAITSKLIRRHPHVFGEAKNLPAEEVKSLWSRIKAEENAMKQKDRAFSSEVGTGSREENAMKQKDREVQRFNQNLKRYRGSQDASPSALAGVPVAMPALTRALKLQEKAGRVGFDWNDIRLVLAKVREEADEIEAALGRGEDRDALAEEIGDLFFAAANLARHADVDAEGALRAANAKFERRFRYIEGALARRGQSGDATLEEMEALWTEAKRGGL